MKTKKRKATVTVKDVARESGLSLSTVIHILGGREQRYREETCRKVHETAQKMGYRRNSSARAMRSGKFDCVALLMSAEPDATLIRQEALEGICDELAAHGMHLNVARLPGQALADEGLVPKLLREWTADGLLVAFAMQIPPSMAERIESSNLPCVWMRSKRDFDCVYLDEMGAARQAVDHLAKLGHRRIAFADYTYGTQSLSASHHGLLDFEAGYRERMTEAGLAPQVIREEDRVERSERAARFRAIFSRKDRPTALIAGRHRRRLGGPADPRRHLHRHDGRPVAGLDRDRAHDAHHPRVRHRAPVGGPRRPADQGARQAPSPAHRQIRPCGSRLLRTPSEAGAFDNGDPELIYSSHSISISADMR